MKAGEGKKIMEYNENYLKKILNKNIALKKSLPPYPNINDIHYRELLTNRQLIDKKIDNMISAMFLKEQDYIELKKELKKNDYVFYKTVAPYLLKYDYFIYPSTNLRNHDNLCIFNSKYKKTKFYRKNVWYTESTPLLSLLEKMGVIAEFNREIGKPIINYYCKKCKKEFMITLNDIYNNRDINASKQ